MPDDPKPLEYATPRSKPSSLGAIIGFAAGFCAGVIGIALTGFAAFVFHPEGSPAPNTKPASIIYFLVAAGALVWGVSFLMFSKRERRMLLAGLLLGIAISSLIEGACFCSG